MKGLIKSRDTQSNGWGLDCRSGTSLRCRSVYSFLRATAAASSRSCVTCRARAFASILGRFRVERVPGETYFRAFVVSKASFVPLKLSARVTAQSAVYNYSSTRQHLVLC